MREGKQLLVVDDEDLVRGVAVKVLKRLGYAVMTAEGGASAVKQVEENPGAFALILLDMTMPGVTGEEAFRRIRLLAPELPVVFMSGAPEDDAMSALGDQPHVQFLQKPFSLDSVKELFEGLKERGILS